MAGSIKGILFDLGDTLLDFGKVDVTGLFEAGARLSYAYLQELSQPLPPLAKFHRRQLRAIRWNYFKSRFTRREFNALELIGRLAMRMGHELTHEHILELAWRWYMPLSQCAKVEDDLPKLLEALRDRGMKLGIVSNTFVPGEVLDRHLQQAQLLDFLPIRVYSCDVGYRKPSPKIFSLALERAGLAPENTLFVGDSPKADIMGSLKAGMIPVLKDPRDLHVRGEAARHARHRIHRLSELSEIIARHNAGK